MGLTKLDPNVIGQDSTGAGKITSAGGSVSIDSSGNVRIANSSANSVVFAANGSVGVGQTVLDGDLNIATTSTYQGIFQRSGGSAGNFALRSSRGTVASPTASANGDNLFQFHFQGYDGTNWRNGAGINAVLNGTISSTSMPADLILKTVPDGSLVETERVRIAASGFVGVACTAPGTLVDIVGSNTAGSTGTYPTLRITNQNTDVTGSNVSVTDIQLRSRNTSGVHGQIASVATASDEYFRVATLTNHPLQIMTNSTERMRIAANGNFGVNNVSPSHTLSVNGTVYVSNTFSTRQGPFAISGGSNVTSVVDPNNSSYWLWTIKLNTVFNMGTGGVFEWTIANNPNAGGSGSYRNYAQGRVQLAVTWNGSSYTPQIVEDTVIFNSTGGTFDAMIYCNGSYSTVAGEYQTTMNNTQTGGAHVMWDHPSIYLRIRMSNGFNTTYPGTKDMTCIFKAHE